jgi:hypothetical protein
MQQVFDFRFPQSWAGAVKDDQFNFVPSDHLQSLLVLQHTFLFSLQIGT